MTGVEIFTATNILAATQIVAGLAGAVGALSQGAAGESAADANAEILRQQAESEEKIAREKARDERRQTSRILAAARARAAGSGIDPSTGTPLLTAGDTAALGELGARRTEVGGEIRAHRLRQQAGLETQAGSQARTRGFFGAGTSLLSGAAGGFKTFTGGSGGSGGARTPRNPVRSESGALIFG